MTKPENQGEDRTKATGQVSYTMVPCMPVVAAMPMMVAAPLFWAGTGGDPNGGTGGPKSSLGFTFAPVAMKVESTNPDSRSKQGETTEPVGSEGSTVLPAFPMWTTFPIVLAIPGGTGNPGGNTGEPKSDLGFG